MTAAVLEQLSNSAQAFKDVIWPIAGPRLGGGSLIHVEEVTAQGFQNDLDCLAGIDAWQVIDRYGIRGIASRVQPWGSSWDTFTVRCKLASGGETEYSKRLRALEHVDKGFLFPHLTIQSYTTKDWTTPLSIAAVTTRDLIFFIRDNPELVQEKPVTGGNHMYVVKWETLLSRGLLKYVWRGGDAASIDSN